MTTPVAPVQAPDTTSAHEFFQQDDTALAASLGINLAPPETEVPDEGDRRLLPEPTVVSAPEEEPETPTNEVAIQPLSRPPMTEFQVMDDEGELQIPDLKIKFKAKGEERNLPLDHVVRLAQFGFANEEREQQVLAARKFVAEAETKEQDYRQMINQYEANYDRLFSDPAFYEQARLAYIDQNSPEMRAQRAEHQLLQHRQHQAVAQQDQTMHAFVEQRLVPMVQQLATNHPLVSEQEVIGRYTELTAPLLVRGRVPVERLPLVQQIVANDLANWIERKSYERTVAKQQTDTATAKATQQVAATKRQAARIFAQPGHSDGNSGATKPVKYDTARSWLDSTFGRPSDE